MVVEVVEGETTSSLAPMTDWLADWMVVNDLCMVYGTPLLSPSIDLTGPHAQ